MSEGSWLNSEREGYEPFSNVVKGLREATSPEKPSDRRRRSRFPTCRSDITVGDRVRFQQAPRYSFRSSQHAPSRAVSRLTKAPGSGPRRRSSRAGMPDCRGPRGRGVPAALGPFRPSVAPSSVESPCVDLQSLLQSRVPSQWHRPAAGSARDRSRTCRPPQTGGWKPASPDVLFLRQR